MWSALSISFAARYRQNRQTSIVERFEEALLICTPLLEEGIERGDDEDDPPLPLLFVTLPRKKNVIETRSLLSADLAG